MLMLDMVDHYGGTMLILGLASFEVIGIAWVYGTNVVTRDFFEFLDKPAKKLGVVPLDSHLRDFMEPWVNRSEHPLVYLVHL